MAERPRVTAIEGAVILLNEIYGRLPHNPEVGVALHGNGWRNYYSPEAKSAIPETFLDNPPKCQLLLDIVDQALDTLNYKERTATRRRFGYTPILEPYSSIDTMRTFGTMRTLEKIGDELGIVDEGVRRIIAKSLRKLRHPSISSGLEQFLPETQALS